MKNILATALIAVVGLSVVSCNDFLDDNRYPETKIVNNPLYWSNPDNCELQVNRMYQYFYGYGNGNGYGNFYFNSLTDDQCSTGFQDWANTAVPTASSNWSTPYTVIRGCNMIIEGVNSSTLTEAQKNNYIGLARLIRGYEYFQLVKKYGDVVLVEAVLDVNSEELYAPRNDRKTVMDYAYEDILFASKNVTLQKGIQKFSKDFASALLSDFCLFEGTFWKYCTQAENGVAPDETRSKLYLNRCVEHSQGLLSSYPIGNNYAALYNSIWKADAATGITGINNNPEVIFATEYEDNVFQHSTIAYTASSTIIRGITKDAFDAYLFKDGKPLALTSENTTDAGVRMESVDGAEDNGPGLSIANLLAVRDKRLSMTTDPYVYYKGMTWARHGSNAMTSSTGYGVCKYDNVLLPVINRVTTGRSTTCSPIFWGAVIALNYAEAKAELGTLTDSDINNTLNKLYARADLPAQTLESLTKMNDPANNMGVSSLIWEVRRCRRCELIMDNDFRYWDLIRWHKLDLLDTTKHPNIILGANVSNAPVACTTVTGNYVNGGFGGNRIFEARQYLYPIPTGQITLNHSLTQNPGW